MPRLLPLVSITIPTYNRADNYLPQTLESALHQTYPNLEIIVSDNCSVDNTEAFVSSITDPRLKYFRQAQNIGPANNVNFCIAQAKGEYTLILHDDDVIDEDFIDSCMRAVNYRVGVGIIRTGTRVIDSNGRVMSQAPNLVGGLSTEDFFRGWFTGKTPLYLCSTLFHTEKLKAIGGLRSKHYLHDDTMAIVQLATALGRADVKDVKASFRRHNQRNTLSPTDISHWCEDALLVLDLMCTSVSEDVALVRKEGERFFANACYKRAAAVKSSLNRFRCYLVVYEKFHYRYFPPNMRYLIRAPFFRLMTYINTLRPGHG
jgi:glycosyltransferase involved in cell wall biosynthesis